MLLFNFNSFIIFNATQHYVSLRYLTPLSLFYSSIIFIGVLISNNNLKKCHFGNNNGYDRFIWL